MPFFYFYLSKRGMHQINLNGQLEKINSVSSLDCYPHAGLRVAYFFLTRGRLYKREISGYVSKINHANLPILEEEAVTAFLDFEKYSYSDEEDRDRLSLPFTMSKYILTDKGGYSNEDIHEMSYELVLYLAQKVIEVN